MAYASPEVEVTLAAALLAGRVLFVPQILTSAQPMVAWETAFQYTLHLVKTVLLTGALCRANMSAYATQATITAHFL